MSIEDKLQTITRNIERTFDAGYELRSKRCNSVVYSELRRQSEKYGVMPYEDEGFDINMQRLSYNVDSIRDLANLQGRDEGIMAERNNFWDVFQKGGEPMSYRCAFAYGRFTDEIYNPLHTIKCTDTASTDAEQMFYLSAITDTKVPIQIGKDKPLNQTFRNAYYLRTIRKLIVTEGCTFASAFESCNALENLTISGVIGQNINLQYSPLTRTSIESVVNALSTSAEGKTVTFKKTAVNEAFTTDEWNRLIKNKGNWQFAFI